MHLTQIKKITKTFWAEILLASLAIAMGSFMLWRVSELGFIKALVDQNSHLNFSRLVIDSMTPGISQLGFWPPLLHILMIPFVAITPLYKTGLAGFFTLIPFLIMGTVFLYKIVLRLTNKKILSLVAPILFLLNPYVLYYTVTPMAEVLFIANLFGVAYFLLSWLDGRRLKHLLLCGLFITLASLSRYEGLILAPLVGMVILLSLIKEKRSYHQIEALLLLFLIPAIAGLIFIIAYSWVYGGDPLIFAGGGWWTRSSIGEVRPATHNLPLAIEYVKYASYYVIGRTQIIIALACLFPLLIFVKRKLRTLIVLLILLSPILFVLFGLYRGSIPLALPEFPPTYKFLNERYALSWIGFVIIIPVVLIDVLLQKNQGRNYNILTTIIGSLFIAGLISLSLYQLYNVSFVEKFETIRNNLSLRTDEQRAVARYLDNNYDYGKVFVARVDNDGLLTEANIPLKNYIQEANYRFYDQTMKQPWLFSRWVIMYNLNEKRVYKWAKEREPIFLKWSESELFHEYYEPVLVNDFKRLYKIKDAAIRKLAEEEGYNLLQIPSVNSQLTWWDPQTIYSKIRTPDSSQVAKKRSSPSKSETKLKLKIFYESDLKPYYKDGFYIDSQHAGNSESQSYALLQSYWVGDKETFNKVWAWTKENLQRKTDHLFSWKFNYSPDTLKVRISDRNSATDADTDIAYALLKAGEDWKNSKHIAEAKLIIKDLWEIETASASGQRNVLAGSWANKKDSAILNPSYFSPFAYRLFAKYDADRDWESLINDGYVTLNMVSGNEMRNGTDIFLPPNWAVFNYKNRGISTFTDKSDSIDYSYDAFRTFWRVAMDQLLYPNNQAKGYLEKASIFKKEWEKNKQFCTIYRFDEGAVSCEFTASTLTGPLAVLSITEPRIADEVVEKYLLSGGDITLPESTSFYHKSWYWFGLMLWTAFDN